MTKPTTWEQGAEQASERILNEFSTFPNTWLNTPDTAVLKAIDWDTDQLRKAAEEAIPARRALQLTRGLANEALELLWRRNGWFTERYINMPKMAEDIVRLVARKQADYGHGNILAFGETGVIVRMSDKVARLRNLWPADGAKAQNESLDDTLRDIYGYAVVFDMLVADTFELPLAADVFAEAMQDLGVIPLPGSEGWERAYHWGDRLEKEFPGQDGAELATACEYNSYGPLNESRIARLVLLQQGERDEDNWRWEVTLEDGAVWIAEGGCDYTGWDCRSHLDWTRQGGQDHAVEATIEADLGGIGWASTPQTVALDDAALRELWRELTSQVNLPPVYTDPDVPEGVLYFLNPSNIDFYPSTYTFDDAMRDVFGGTDVQQSSLFELLGGVRL